VLIPAVIAARLFASRGDALATAPVRPGNPLTERPVNFIVKEAAERAVAGRPRCRWCATHERGAANG